MSACPQRHRLRSARQRHSELHRPDPPATNLRRPLGREDRRSAAQMAAPAAAPVHRRRPGGQLSLLQAEFSLTQVLDRPLHGRLFFEQVIRENLDIGRPEDVRLIFNRKITRRTPGSFRTRIVTHDVTPSLNVYYKNTRIKQYHK